MLTSGLEISFGENDRQGAGRIFLTEIKNKKLNWLEGEAFVKPKPN